MPIVIFATCLSAMEQHTGEIPEQPSSEQSQGSASPQAMLLETDEHGNKIARFTTRSALEHYLNRRTGNEVWQQVKPAPGTDMNVFMRKNPCFILQAQTQFALVQEMAPEFWDILLEKLPGNSFSAQQLKELITSMGDEIGKQRIASENDASVHFMISMQTLTQTQGFLEVFLKSKDDASDNQ